MKVNIKGSAIDSAYYEDIAGKIPKLVINTKDKHVHWYCTNSDLNSIKFEYKHNSYVELVAEDAIEIEILKRVMFECHCKDQKIVLFVSECLL